MCLWTHRSSVADILRLPDLLHHLNIHSHQSSASEMEDTALGILFYFFFPEIIFNVGILTVHFIDLIL